MLFVNSPIILRLRMEGDCNFTGVLTSLRVITKLCWPTLCQRSPVVVRKPLGSSTRSIRNPATGHSFISVLTHFRTSQPTCIWHTTILYTQFILSFMWTYSKRLPNQKRVGIHLYSALRSWLYNMPSSIVSSSFISLDI